MTLTAAIAAQFKPRVSEAVALGRISICECCASARKSRIGDTRLLRCAECACLLSVNGEVFNPYFNTKTATAGEHCPRGMW